MSSHTHSTTVASRALLWLVFALASLWTAGIVAVPVLEGSSSEGVTGAAGLARLTYGTVCHQMPERSLVLAGRSLTVCSRCTGLYVGALAGLALGAALWRPGRRAPRPIWLAVALVPSVIDFGIGHLGLPALSDIPRLLVAAPAGAVAGLLLCEGVADLGRLIAERRRHGLLASAVPPHAGAEAHE